MKFRTESAHQQPEKAKKKKNSAGGCVSLCLLMSDADLALTRHIHTRETITHACIQMPVNITRKKK